MTGKIVHPVFESSSTPWALSTTKSRSSVIPFGRHPLRMLPAPSPPRVPDGPDHDVMPRVPLCSIGGRAAALSRDDAGEHDYSPTTSAIRRPDGSWQSSAWRCGHGILLPQIVAAYPHEQDKHTWQQAVIYFPPAARWHPGRRQQRPDAEHAAGEKARLQVRVEIRRELRRSPPRAVCGVEHRESRSSMSIVLPLSRPTALQRTTRLSAVWIPSRAE